MSRLDIANAALLAACAALAWRSGERPLALTLAWGLASHLALCAMDAWLPHYEGPYVGGRAAWHRADIALRCAWPGVVLVGATVTFTAPMPPLADVYTRATAALYALTALYVAWSYPALRGAPLLDLYRALRVLACVGVMLGLVVAWRRPRGAAQWSAVALVAGMGANTLAGAWAWGNVVADWGAARMISCMTYLCVAALLGRDMMSRRRCGDDRG